MAMREKTDGLAILSSPCSVQPLAPSPWRNLLRATGFRRFRRFPNLSSSGLMGYGTSVPDLFHQAGILVGRVLKGEKPADMPVERPTRLRLTLNMKTAKTLGLDLPLSLTGRADEVIE